MENVKEIVKIGQKLTAHKVDSPDDMQLAADYLAYTLCHVR